MILNQCGLYLLTPLRPSNAMVLPYDDIYLSQHGLRLGLVAWQHHAITWTYVDLSLMRFSGIHLRAISQQVPKPLLCKITMIIHDYEITATSPRGQLFNNQLHLTDMMIITKLCTTMWPQNSSPLPIEVSTYLYFYRTIKFALRHRSWLGGSNTLPW